LEAHSEEWIVEQDYENVIHIMVRVGNETFEAGALLREPAADISHVQHQTAAQVTLLIQAKTVGELMAQCIREWVGSQPKRLHWRDRLYVFAYTALVKGLKEPNTAERLTAVGYVPPSAIQQTGGAIHQVK
jgi:hypothetical protein